MLNGRTINIHDDFNNSYEMAVYVNVQLYREEDIEIELDFAAVDMSSSNVI